VFGIEINSEWRSDIKWSRLSKHLPPLKNLHLLDVGCGNGYYLLRMLGEGASCVVGVDPSLLFSAQFSALKTYIGQHLPAYILPLRFEDMVKETSLFDGIFSMGVIYHRKDPLGHLLNLQKMLQPGGFLVMESIVWDEDSPGCLIPKQRYAGMRNVWSIPSPLQMEQWLQKTRWTDIQYVSQERTSLQEQRRTEWMPFHSLAEFLDPANIAHTMEGYPAPVRGIWIARKTDT
jgi:tRNA (mo5U34)-methyltransferase